jgi:DNA repair protein RadC
MTKKHHTQHINERFDSKEEIVEYLQRKTRGKTERFIVLYFETPQNSILQYVTPEVLSSDMLMVEITMKKMRAKGIIYVVVAHYVPCKELQISAADRQMAKDLLESKKLLGLVGFNYFSINESGYKEVM